MKTASDHLKQKDSVPTDPEANNTTISQPGPEDGRDQNIRPDSNSYDPDNEKSRERGINHNAEVYRSDEDDSYKGRDRK